ncbi:hypothetical protein KDL29_07040 [bacterium]|nr:hypothetical protein [bacterium]
MLRTTVLFLLLMAAMYEPCLAWTPEIGNRALPLYGTDRVSGQLIELDSMKGKWVLLEAWATW